MRIMGISYNGKVIRRIKGLDCTMKVAEDIVAEKMIEGRLTLKEDV